MKPYNLKKATDHTRAYNRLYDLARNAEKTIKDFPEGSFSRTNWERYRAGYLADASAEWDARQPILDELDALIRSAEGRATVRTIKALDIVEDLADIEDMLSIPKKAMDGITVYVDLNAQTFPSAYKYTPESTQYTATYKNGTWRVLSIERLPVRSPSNEHQITHTEASKAALISRFSTF